MFDSQCGQMRVGNQRRSTTKVAQQSAQNGIMFGACMRDPDVTAIEPRFYLLPGPCDRLRALIDARIRYNPKKS
jgi:hypothetical protein